MIGGRLPRRVGHHVQLDHGPAPLLAGLPVAGPDGQAMEPGIPRVGVSQGAQVSPGRDERLLDRVLGAVPVAEDEVATAYSRSTEPSTRVVNASWSPPIARSRALAACRPPVRRGTSGRVRTTMRRGDPRTVPSLRKSSTDRTVAQAEALAVQAAVALPYDHPAHPCGAPLDARLAARSTEEARGRPDILAHGAGRCPRPG